MTENDPLLTALPPQIAEKIQPDWHELSARLQATAGWALFDRQALLKALSYSDFLRDTLRRSTDAVIELAQAGLLDQPYQKASLLAHWARITTSHASLSIDSESTLMQRLRQFRRDMMFCIIWRDLLKHSDLKETMAAMSDLADVCIAQASDWLYADACRQWGTPWGRLSDGREGAQSLLVLGMGKLGAGELNVSSDIDLIFAYPANGETQGVARSIDNQQFFIRLGQRLINALDKVTADGFVFRVDMRLRPDGQSGPLALSFNAVEAYYQNQGRDWERYAMVKARVVAGDPTEGDRLLAALRPFVYRKYIDFSAFESLRAMKGMIVREVRRKGLETNIKLGAGGIREIEFIVQAFQLIRGGRDRQLQRRELLQVLPLLGQLGLLPAVAVEQLTQAYIFLRNTEHALQGIADQQTQHLPAEPLGQWRVAQIMGFADWDAFSVALEQHRQCVGQHFSAIIATEETAQSQQTVDESWQDLWQGQLSGEEALIFLTRHGFESPADDLAALARLRQSRVVAQLQSQPLKRLNQFMPLLLCALTQVEQPSQTLDRLLRLVESVLRRTAYLLLLIENPQALSNLLFLCNASPWIAARLTETPMLLDELLKAESLFAPPSKSDLEDDLRQQLLRIPLEDLEEQMECLRRFKKGHVLRVAASELRGTLPLMKVSDYLTWIAEVVLACTVDLAWQHQVSKHGYPTGEDGRPLDAGADHRGFAVIGYGKLGGIELGYTSDLDLVFIHGTDPTGATCGEKPVDNAIFFTRLGQRIVHMLSAQTPSGQLYDVDMRLRPSGNSGLLVSTLAAFAKYQRKDAWTWEHQALTRARWVAGSADVGEAFEQLRRDILGLPRDPEALRQAVMAMRDKMRQALASPLDAQGQAAQFHIKQDPGGIVDIEFIVQYLVLAWSHQYPQLARWSDNIRQMEQAGECGLLTPDVQAQLRDVYIALRSSIHRRALQQQNSKAPPDAFAQERAWVGDLWRQFFF